MSEESDPQAITDALAAAVDAFNEAGHGVPTREEQIDTDADWKSQLTKACRLLAAVEHLAGQGLYTATIELCFGATERSIEAYALAEGGDSLDDFHDHTHCYSRGTDLGLLSATTTDSSPPVRYQPHGQLLRRTTPDRTTGRRDAATGLERTQPRHQPDSRGWSMCLRHDVELSRKKYHVTKN